MNETVKNAGQALIGVVTNVLYDSNGEGLIVSVLPDVQGQYKADVSDRVTYNVSVTLPSGGTVEYEGVKPAFARQWPGFGIICHPVGFPCSVTILNGSMFFRFEEAPQSEICP